MSEWNDIGEELRKKREGAGLLLADISHQLRIPVTTLKALESNNYSHFASPAYAKSFLQQYSQHLDIDVQDWLPFFDTSTVLSDLANYHYLNPDPEDQPRRGRNVRAKERRKEARSLHAVPIVLFLISVILIAGLLYAYVYFDKLIAKTTSPDEQNSEQNSPELSPSPENGLSSSAQIKPASNDQSESAENITPSRGVIIPEANPIPRAIIVPEDNVSERNHQPNQ